MIQPQNHSPTQPLGIEANDISVRVRHANQSVQDRLRNLAHGSEIIISTHVNASCCPEDDRRELQDVDKEGQECGNC
jgi:hypothetical protein